MASHPIYRIENTDLFGNLNKNKYYLPEFSDMESYEYINSLYKSVFGRYKDNNCPADIVEKDLKIIKSFTNVKSFENAIDVCVKLLSHYNEEVYEEGTEPNDKVKVTMDSKIICDSLDVLAECRVPSQYKSGFLILIVRYCYKISVKQLS